MKYFILSIFLLFFGATSTAQRCTLVSMTHFGGDGYDVIEFGSGMYIDSTGNFSIAINSSSVTGSIQNTCLQPNGNGAFFRTYGPDFTGVISQTCAPRGENFQRQTFFFYPQPNGDTILIGHSTLNHNDIAMERRNGSNVIWSKHYGGSASELFGYSGVTPTEGGFIFGVGTYSDDGDVGFHYGNQFNSDMWIFKVDYDGDILWSKVIGGTAQDIIYNVQPASNGGCYVFGGTSSTDFDMVANHGQADLYIAKLDSMGTVIWSRLYGGSGYEAGFPIAMLNDNHLHVLGQTNSTDGDVHNLVSDDRDFWLIKLDTLGNIIWEHTYGGPEDQRPTTLCRATDGSFWMGGTIVGGLPSSSGGQIDVRYGKNDGWVAHADSAGNFINQMVFGTDNNEEQIDMLHPLGNGKVLAGGRYSYISNPGTSHSEQFPEVIEGPVNIFLAVLSPNTTSIFEPSRYLEKWDVYPNPASGNLIVNVKSRETFAMGIFNAEGKVHFNKKIKGSTTIDIRGWPPGVYTIKITNKENSLSSKKISIH